MSYIFEQLVQCDARSKLMRLLFLEQRVGSVSELARRAGLSPRAIGVEVDHLLGLGLVRAEVVDAARVVSANEAHPATDALKALLLLPVPGEKPDENALRSTLAAFGAPLMVNSPPSTMPLEAAIVAALEVAKHDGTILRVLPVVVAKNLARLDWTELIEGARKADLKAELGWLLEVTGMLIGEASLSQRAASLQDRRRRRMTYFPMTTNQYERRLAEEVTSEFARKWGFYMNVSEESLRSMIAKHAPEVRLA